MRAECSCARSGFSTTWPATVLHPYATLRGTERPCGSLALRAPPERPVRAARGQIKAMCLRGGGLRHPVTVIPSPVFVLSQSCLTLLDVFPRRAPHGAFSNQNDHRILAQFMLLPLNFQFYFWRGVLSANFLQVFDCQLALRVDPFTACAWRSCFSNDLDWHLVPPKSNP